MTMSHISSMQDTSAATFTFVAQFDAPPERVWQVWEDARQLERWWGPPTWPATFESHDFRVGGSSRYYMTGPDGERAHGWWDITAIDAPTRLEFTDGFGTDDGGRDESIAPSRAEVTLEAVQDGTRMTTVTHFADADHLAQMASMGMEEGMTLAMGQIDGLLAEARMGR